MISKTLAEMQVNYNQVQQQWLTKLDAVQSKKATLVKTKEELGSWSLSLLQRVGLKSETRKLLLAQRDHIEIEIKDLTQDLNDLEPIVRKLRMDVRAMDTKQQEEISRCMQDAILAEYAADPQQFWQRILFDLLPGAEGLKQKDKVFTSADKIIAVSSALSVSTNPQNLLHAWKIVSKASHLDFEQYHTGAKRVFFTLLSSLPAGMQGLMFLYMVKDYDRVDYYLAEAYEIEMRNHPEQFAALLNALTDEVSITSIINANRILSKISGFNHLSKEMKAQLIEQHAYGMRLRYDLAFSDIVPKGETITVLKAYSKKLEHNVIDLIANHRTPTQGKVDFELLKSAIDKREFEIKGLFPLGLGLGPAWILGLGATVMPDRLSNNEAWLRMIDIERDVELAGLVLPMDYEFIHDLEELWAMPNNHNSLDIISTIPTELITENIPVRMLAMVFGSAFVILVATWLVLARLWPFYVIAVLFTCLALSYVLAKNSLFANAFAFLFARFWPHASILNAKQLFNYNDLTDFEIPIQLSLILDRAYPAFGAKLLEHFQHRAMTLQSTIRLAHSTGNKSAAELIKLDLFKLVHDWQEILNAIPKRGQFRLVVEQYLYDRYVLELDEYVNVAKDRRDESLKDKMFDLSKDTTTMVFGSKFPEFNINFAEHYIQRRQEMQDLYELKKMF